ncbi:ribosomal protection-like ABC-F family protein [Alkalicoccobacillus porphyridii]|uniref:ABC-F family ATP-binding cassette domain-containing protein n=1 Tax=Alkalicoccobacillus porphyridii TaxID=2597270 RepID=A0A554A472_9BACI|nr:ABC-F family ATP-binding cassette domain-containing protein [Alkalicoccobacillus porphyridii]TSB48475.1 ABC-F family ATP-binding cassette domain-containing protein [Alkalicoccobacillus porphyridii]
MTIVYLHEVSQSFGVHLVFEKLSLEIKQGERVGLVGRNGEGKTSLLHIMGEVTQPSAGRVGWKKGCTKGTLEQNPEYGDVLVSDILADVFHELRYIEIRLRELEAELERVEDTAKMEKLLARYGELQQQFMELGGYEVEADIRRVSSGLGIQTLLGKQWEQLSGGERTKVGLARLLLRKPNLLLLDEPTNHLDLQASEWLTDWIKQYKGTVVSISHDRAFLDDTVTRIIEMDNGELQTYHTNYSGFVKEREERLLLEFQQYQDQQKKIKKMQEAIKRLKDWANRSNPPNAGLHKKAKSMEKALARINLLKKPVLQQRKMHLSFDQKGRSGTDVVTLTNVNKGFGTEQPVLKDVNFQLAYQERVAIVGANGAGKSTLFQLILGEMKADFGDVKVGESVSIGSLSQHGNELLPEQRVIDAFRDSAHVEEGAARNELAGFLFYGEDVFKKVKDLSGGERMRLRLAQLLHEQHNLLLLDEPTNHLDIDSREILEEALEAFQGTILCISHDRYFLNKLFQRTCWLEEGKLTSYVGNYEYARNKKFY